jgi:DNA-binding transcriptional LysR family regulator
VLVIITMVNISAVDLNLLHVLHAVLAEGSATRAAKRLHVTQSAVSNALARLRQTLGDPLVVRNSRGLSATPRARELEPELAAIMASVGRLLDPRANFDPATTNREFTLACADYCTAILGPALAELMHVHAPLATLRLVTLEQLQGAEGLASNIDLHLGMPPRVPSGCRWSALFQDSFVCMVPRGRKRPAKRLGLQQYLRASHVRVSVLNSTRDAIDVALAKIGHARKVALTVPYFAVVPSIVERTGYIATLSRRLAETQARRFDVALLESPLQLGKRPTRMIWHERNDADPGARFFRRLVQEAVNA